MDEGDIEDGEILDDEAVGDSENEYHDGDRDQKARNKNLFKNNVLPDEQKREYGLPEAKGGSSGFKSKSSEQTFNGNHGDKSIKEETVAVRKRRSSRASESSSSDHHAVAKRRSSTASASLTAVRKKRRRSTERKDNVGISDEDDIICISGGSLNNGSRTSFGTEVPNTSGSSSGSGGGKKTSSVASRPVGGRKEPLLPDPKVPPGGGNGSFLKSNSDRNYHHDRYHPHQEPGGGVRRTNSGRGKFNSDIGAGRATAGGGATTGRAAPALIKSKEEPSSGAGGISQDLCIFFLHGKCNRGSECNFIHALTRPKKLEPCKFYVMDRCNKRDQCVYMHNDFPCKFYHTGSTCYQGKECKFSHRKLDDLHRKVLWKYLNKNDAVPASFSADDRLAPPPSLPSKRTISALDDLSEDDYLADGDYRHHSRLPQGTGLSRKDAKDSRIPSLFDIKVSIPTSVDKYEDMIADAAPDADYINSDEIDERPFSSSAVEDDKPLRNKYKQAPPLLNNNRRYNSRHTHDNFLAGPPVDYHERAPLVSGKSSKFPDQEDRNCRRRVDNRSTSRRNRSSHSARAESSDYEDNNNGGKYYNSAAEDDHNTPMCSPRSLTGFNNDNDDDDDDDDVVVGDADEMREVDGKIVTGATLNDGAEAPTGSHRRRSDEEHDRSSNSGRKRSKKKSGKHHHHHHHQMRSDSEEKKYLEREIRKLNRKEQKQRDRQRRKHEIQNYDFPTPEKEQEPDEGQWQQRDQPAVNNKEDEDDVGQVKMVQLSEAASRLPKKQQELYRRILQQQKEVNDCGEPLPESEAAADGDIREEERYASGAAAANEDVDWYSSDEESSAITTGVSSLDVILKSIKPAAVPATDKPSTRNDLLRPSSNRGSMAAESSAALLNISELSNIVISDEVSKILSSIRQQSAANEVAADSGTASSNATVNSGNGSSVASSSESKQCGWIDAVPSSLLAGSDIIAGNEQSSAINMNNLPFKPIPMHDIATEIDASITSHPPMEYKLIPLDPIPKVNYAAMPSSCRLNDLDPRFNRLSVADQSADAPLTTPSTGLSSAALSKSSDPRLETGSKHLLINTLPPAVNPLPVTNSLPPVTAFQPAGNAAIIAKKSESELLPPRDPRLSRTAAATTAAQLADPRLSAVTSKNAPPVPINLNLITQVPPPNLNIPPQINPNVPPLLTTTLPMTVVSQNESRIPSALTRPTDPRIRFKSNLSAK